MLTLLRRRLGLLRFRRRWGALAADAASRADRATALHERDRPPQAGPRFRFLRRRPRRFG